jgi:hypothetical protein
MEDIYKILSTQDAWSLKNSSSTEHFDVTEFWEDAAGSISVENRRVGSEDQEREAWLERRTRDSQRLIVRFVWLKADLENKEVDLSKPIKNQIIDKFGLNLAYRYFHSFTCGVSALPKTVKDGSERQAFAFCFAPKLASIWSHTCFKDEVTGQASSVTEGIIFNATSASKPDGPKLSDMLSKFPCNRHVCRNPAFPAFLLSLHLGQQIQRAHTGIVGKMQVIEDRTGHHDFHRPQGNPNPERLASLNSLSAEVSGHALRLASVSRKAAMVRELLQFVRRIEQLRRTSESNPMLGPESDGLRLLEDFVEVLQDRLDMQNMETEFTLKRVQVQMEAIFHLIAQEDSIHNLEMSANALQISSSTAKIAFDTHRDATSMKTLAIVTMFFLPGSFVSAIFSTELFDWESAKSSNRRGIGIPSTPQMTLYWAITIPLTVLTFALYFVWLRFQKRQSEKAFKIINSTDMANTPKPAEQPSQTQLHNNARENENAVLSRRKMQYLITRNSTLSNHEEKGIV